MFCEMLRGTNWGQKFAIQKIKRANIKVYPLMFLGQFFVPRKEKQSRSHHMMIFEAHCKYNKV